MRINLPPRRTYEKPTHCRICNDELNKDNAYTYLGYMKRECRPCKSKRAKEYTDKRKKHFGTYKRF